MTDLQKMTGEQLVDNIDIRTTAVGKGFITELRRRLSLHRWHRFDDPDNPPPREDGVPFVVIYWPALMPRYLECFWDCDCQDWRINYRLLGEERPPTHYMLITPPEVEGGSAGMTDLTAQAIINLVHETIAVDLNARGLSIEWWKHTCGECGYWYEIREGELFVMSSKRAISGAICRKCGMKLYDPFDRACPDFTPKPEVANDEP